MKKSSVIYKGKVYLVTDEKGDKLVIQNPETGKKITVSRKNVKPAKPEDVFQLPGDDVAFTGWQDDDLYEYDPEIDIPQKLHLQIGESFVGLFLGINEYPWEEKIIRSVILRNLKDGYTYSLGGAHPVRYFSLRGKPKRFYLITRMPDVDTGQPTPMKSYRYKPASDELQSVLIKQLLNNMHGKGANDAPF